MANTAPIAAEPALVVYDSRIPRSVAFARLHGGAKLDVATQDARRWRRLREPLPAGRIVGLTRWSDLVLVRGFGEDQRKRLRSEMRDGALFRWELG